MSRLTLNERRMVRTLVIESEGLLTEGMISNIINYIKNKISPEKLESAAEDIKDGLGVDENSTKEEIEQSILEKTQGSTKMNILKRVLKEVLGFGTGYLILNITHNLLASGIESSGYNPIAIIAAAIFIIIRNSQPFEKVRRKVLGPKIDQFIHGRRSHLGDYDKEEGNVSESKKKVIKLTESDLVRIVKRVIREQKAAPYLEEYVPIEKEKKSYPELSILTNPMYGWGQVVFSTNFFGKDQQLRSNKSVSYDCAKKTLSNDDSGVLALSQIHDLNNKPVNPTQLQAKLDGFCQMATQMGLDKRYQM